MRLPRFVRTWSVRTDPTLYRRPANQPGPGLVFRSGPFVDRFFWRESSARRYASDHSDDNPTVLRLGWVKSDA